MFSLMRLAKNHCPVLVHTLAIVANPTKTGALELAEALARVSQGLGVATQIYKTYPLAKGFLKNKDLCVVIGGDGTLLGVVPEAIDKQVPVLGINRGKLGFLATFGEEVVTQFRDILRGKFCVDKRSVLSCKTASQETYLSLNDIVIKSQHVTDLIQIELSLKSKEGIQPLVEYACDGLLICTPTGSTAYNLSAGGPIVHPQAKIITVTPICPHTLSNRSLVFDHSAVFVIHFKSPKGSEAHITLDGRILPLKEGTLPLEVSIDQQSFPLIVPLAYEPFKTLANKLRWG